MLRLRVGLLELLIGIVAAMGLDALPYYLDTDAAIVASARHTIDEVLADHKHGA